MSKIADGPVSLEQVRGHLRWRHRAGGETNVVHVHQLVAIADGADPYKIFSGGTYHTHHDNEVRFDNRPENLEVRPAEDHNADRPEAAALGATNWSELPEWRPGVGPLTA